MRRLIGITLLLATLLLVVVVLVSSHRRHQQQLSRQLLAAVLRHDQGSVVALLSQGADPNDRYYPEYPTASRQERDRLDQPPNGTTPIMDAAFWGDTASVQALLSHGADPNAVDIGGGSALDHARMGAKYMVWEIWQKGGARMTSAAILEQYARMFSLLRRYGGRSNLPQVRT